MTARQRSDRTPLRVGDEVIARGRSYIVEEVGNPDRGEGPWTHCPTEVFGVSNNAEHEDWLSLNEIDAAWRDGKPIDI